MSQSAQHSVTPQLHRKGAGRDLNAGQVESVPAQRHRRYDEDGAGNVQTKKECTVKTNSRFGRVDPYNRVEVIPNLNIILKFFL